MAAALAAGALVCAWLMPAPARAESREVTLAILPPGTTVEDLAQVDGLSLGVMSAGIGNVPAEQTYLDISQGNRVDGALYDRGLPPLTPFADRVPGWGEIVARANSVPGSIAPGLLGADLRGVVESSAGTGLVAPALVVADAIGAVSRTIPSRCAREPCFVFRVIRASPATLGRLVRGLGRHDLLVALAAPPPSTDGALPIGIAGDGFNGDLTSDSTRTSGYVLSTDLAPTILKALGREISSDADGEVIRAVGRIDPDAVEERAERMSAIPGRRAPVVILSLLAWVLGAATIALVRPIWRRTAFSWLAVSFAYMPLLLLAGAAIEPSGLVEGLVVGFGAGALAAMTVRLIRAWWALAVACAITVIAYAIDVATGSSLTALSLLGPNPIFGVRFYGIGNELEALIAVMVPVGVGGAVTGVAASGRSVSERAVGAAFLGAAVVAAIVFAVGRFGADVGAAIVLPVGAAVALAALPGPEGAKRPVSMRRRFAVPLIAAPIVGLTALLLVDLVSHGNGHLTRSVLHAGGAHSLADVAERRLRLSAHDFAQAAGNLLFWIVVLGIALAIAKWRRIDAWLEPFPAARAGLIGACAAVAVGVLVNDSGATFLVLGSLALGAAVAFAWAQAPGPEPALTGSPRNAKEPTG